MATFATRVKNAWNAFTTVRNPESPENFSNGFLTGVSTTRPDRPRIRYSNERTIISSIYTRLGIDVSDADIRHTRHDDADRYLEDMDSGLQDCLTVEPNIDQGPRQFRQNIAMALFDKGVAAIVPVDTVMSPLQTGGFDIRSMRVGEIVQWYPRHIRVNLYNEATGLKEDITLPKRICAIVENPLYDVMNQPNSTLQRLIRKLNLLDTVDEASSSGKMDLIIQLPYVIKSDARRKDAEQRRKDIEFQLKGSQYGIAYTDGTEKITQLNRPVENNLLEQITTLTNQLYVQLGLTPEVMNGTADEAAMLNYNNRTIQPIMDAIVEAMRRAWLTKTARTQKQSIDYFRDPFKLVPLSQIAEISDKMTRNEIMTSNEVRQFIGMKPSQDPKADQLINSNMPVGDTGVATAPDGTPLPDGTTGAEGDPNTVPTAMSSSFDSIDSAMDDAFSALGIDEGTISHADMSGQQVPVDPGIMKSSMDEIMQAIDEAFAGLELD